MKGDNNTPDWEAIERDYRAGLLSIREVGRKHTVSESTVRRKAKECKWSRDLTKKVQQRVNEKIRTKAKKKKKAPTPYSPEEEERVIEEAATEAAEVIHGHQQTIAKARNTVNLLMGQMDAAVKKVCQKDDNGKPVLMPPTELKTYSSVAMNLTNALGSLIRQERQAWNIVDHVEPEKATTLMSDAELVAALDEISSQA